MPERKCPQCHLTCTGKKPWLQHMHEIHGKYLHVCEPCNMAFVSRNELKCHNDSKHQGNAAMIGNAMAMLSVSSPKKRTRKRKTKQSKQCPNCSASFKTGKARRRHVHKNHGPLPDFCETCKEPFLTHGALQQHDNAFHSFSTLPTTRRVRSVMTQKMSSSTSAQPPDDLYDCHKDDLDSFIALYVQPDAKFKSQNNRIVNWLVKILQNSAPDCLRPRRIIKGGSLGKGTAVKGKSDIDLVVMLRDYRDVPTLISNMGVLLDKLKSFLNGYKKVTIEKRTDYNISIEVRKGDNSISADVLLAVDVLAIGSSKEAVFREMAHSDNRTRQFFSASLSPLQLELYATLPPKLKSLIRLIKYWKKNKVMTEFRGSTLPTAYVFDTVILDAWHRANPPDNFDMTRAAHAVLTSLMNHDRLRVMLGRQEGKNFIELPHGLPHGAFIMDPCNPFNDLYRKWMWDWGDVATAAREWLQKPLFYGVDGTRNQW